MALCELRIFGSYCHDYSALLIPKMLLLLRTQSQWPLDLSKGGADIVTCLLCGSAVTEHSYQIWITIILGKVRVHVLNALFLMFLFSFCSLGTPYGKCSSFVEISIW